MAHDHYKDGIPSPTYASWNAMKQRCNNDKRTNYAEYGGLDIIYQSSWERFENFLADMGERPVGTVLDRKDNNKDYSKENCRWSTYAVSAQNRYSTKLSVESVQQILDLYKAGYKQDWIARRFDVKQQTISTVITGARWRNA